VGPFPAEAATSDVRSSPRGGGEADELPTRITVALDWLARSSTGASSWPKAVGKAAVGALVVAEVAVVVFLVARPTPEPDRPTRLNIRGAGSHSKSHSNPTSGLSFEYPAGWAVEDDGSVSRVTSRDEDSVISIGPGPSGDALTAMEEAQGLFEQTYTDLDITERGVESVNNRLAITTVGRAVNEIGAVLRFGAVSVEYGEGTIMATEFDTGDGRPGLSRELNALLDSVQPPNGSI